jgi:multiple sugar transport system substrate-binding protein
VLTPVTKDTHRLFSLRFRRTANLAVVLGLLGLFLAHSMGCRDSQVDDDRTRVVFWHSFVSSTIPALEELVARFEEEHPHIRLHAQYVPGGDALIQRLMNAVRSNTAPDIAWIHSNYLEPLVNADAVYPMAHFTNGPNGLTQEELDDFYPALIQYASYRGTLYSIPMEATNLGIVYNRDLFREVGLDPDRPPQTWEELIEYSQRLYRDQAGRGRPDRVGFLVPISPATGPEGPWMVWQWMPFIWQAGGDLIDEEQSRVLFAEEEGVRALTLWKDLYEMQNLRNFTTEHQSAFISKQGAMMLDGPWSIPNYPRLLRDIDWAIAPLPAGPVKQATVVGGEYLAIFRQSQHPDAAWEFLRWMAQPEVQAFWSEKSGYLPTRASVRDVPEYQHYLESNPALKVYVDQMEVAQAQRPIDFFPIEIEREIAIAIERATVGREDPQEVLTRAANNANAMLDRADRRMPASTATPPPQHVETAEDEAADKPVVDQ